VIQPLTHQNTCSSRSNGTQAREKQQFTDGRRCYRDLSKTFPASTWEHAALTCHMGTKHWGSGFTFSSNVLAMEVSRSSFYILQCYFTYRQLSTVKELVIKV